MLTTCIIADWHCKERSSGVPGLAVLVSRLRQHVIAVLAVYDKQRAGESPSTWTSMPCQHLLTNESTLPRPCVSQSQAALLFEFVHRDQLQRFFKLYGSTCGYFYTYVLIVGYRVSEQNPVTCTLPCVWQP